MNEAEQSISYYLPETGLTRRAGANFQRTAITIKTIDLNSSSQVTSEWSRDRTNGAITRSTVISFGKPESGIAPMKMQDEGKCTKQPVPKRDF